MFQLLPIILPYLPSILFSPFSLPSFTDYQALICYIPSLLSFILCSLNNLLCYFLFFSFSLLTSLFFSIHSCHSLLHSPLLMFHKITIHYILSFFTILCILFFTLLFPLSIYFSFSSCDGLPHSPFRHFHSLIMYFFPFSSHPVSFPLPYFFSFH